MLQLLDLAGIYFRAFFAVPGSVRSPDGMPVNAVRGSLDIIRRVAEDGRPTHLVACLDLDWRPAFRVAAIPSYKTHRVLTSAPPVRGVAQEVVPDELSPQVPVLLDILGAMGIALAGAEGYEADDVIGTLAEHRSRPVEVVTGDRDLMQLATDDEPPVRLRYIGAGMAKTEVLTGAAVAAKYGIPAAGYADFAALRGDPSDGLPGVPGVGDKTAASLIARFGTLEGLVAAVADPTSGLTASMRHKLTPSLEYLEAAKTVVRVARDTTVILDRPDPVVPAAAADPERLAGLAARYGVVNSVDRLGRTLTELAG
ncbi:5'-3' exonuclease [Nakamurella deserti]|uniref:5'-3' exonuclease n=1 Tax=Nakamurella deserti TaxID=2164074 RepID=UPI000DBE658A|nr:5'-3' exonuclease [Nakamurella deserti]